MRCAVRAVSAGACLTMGPAQVLAGGKDLQLPISVNIGLNSQGLHIMDSQQYRWVGDSAVPLLLFACVCV